MSGSTLTTAGLLMAAASAQALPASTSTLSAGDLAFTSFNADEDGWAMVSFVDILPNTILYFTDNEWTGTAFNTGESFHSWNLGANVLAAGTVVRFSLIDNATQLSASVGTLSRAAVTGSTNFGINQTEDTVYAYQATSAAGPATVLAAITNGTFGTASSGLLDNTGLSVGNGAVQLTASSDFAEYAGTRNNLGTLASYKPLGEQCGPMDGAGRRHICNRGAQHGGLHRGGPGTEHGRPDARGTGTDGYGAAAWPLRTSDPSSRHERPCAAAAV